MSVSRLERRFGLTVLSVAALFLLIVPMHPFPLIGPLAASGATAQEADFQSRRLYYESSPLARGSIGDAIPERPGNELISCSFGGIVTATYGSGDSWTSEIVYKAYYGDSQEMVQVNSVLVTDVLPEVPGDEVLSVGNDMNLRLSLRDGSRWRTNVIHSDVDWLYEVAASDLDGDGQKEIVIVGETKTLTLLERKGTAWSGEVIARDTYLLEACAIADVDGSFTGFEIVSGGKSGRVLMSYVDGGSYHQRTIADLSTDITDIVVVDMDSDHQGDEVFASAKNGKVYMIYQDGPQWVKKVVHDEGDIIYGMEAGQLYGLGPVLLTASYKHRVGVVASSDDGYTFRTIYSEEWNILGSVIGDLDPTHIGNEVISLSQLGRLTMLYRDLPGIEVRLPFTTTAAGPGEVMAVPFSVRTKGGLEGECSLSVKGPAGTDVSPRTLLPPGAAVVHMLAPSSKGTYDINITATIGDTRSSTILFLIVKEGSSPLSFSDPVLEGYVTKDRETRFTLSASSETGLPSPLQLSFLPLPTGITTTLDRTSCDPCMIPEAITMTLSADPSTVPERYVLFLIGSSTGDLRRAAAIVLNVTEEAIADFRIDVSGTAEGIVRGGSAEIEVRLISENGFDAIVNISTGPMPEGVSLELSRDRVRPTGNLTATVSGNSTGGPYIVSIVAAYGPIEKTAYIRVSFKDAVLPPSVRGPPVPVVPEMKDDGECVWTFQVTLDPGSEPIKAISLMVPDLPDGLNASMIPPDVGSLPYPVNVTVTVWGPPGPDPFGINITLKDVKTGTEYSDLVELDIPDQEGDDGEGRFPLVPVAILATLSLGAIVIIFLIARPWRKGSNVLKSEEGLSKGHDRARPPVKGDSTHELHDGGRSGMDRRIHRFR